VGIPSTLEEIVMKFVFALVTALACTAALGQASFRPATGEMLLAPKKSPLSLNVYRGSQLCGLRDCGADDRLGVDPCVSSVLGCHFATEAKSYRTAPFGGVKLSGTVGDVTLSVGRHNDNALLAHALVLEGAYRLAPRTEAEFGVVGRHTDQGKSDPTLFLLWKKEL
jgi:hypothetical protein